MTEAKTYKTYIIPFTPEYGYPQTTRLSIYKWVFDFVWSYNSVSNMPILTIKGTNGTIYSINQLTPYNALYTHDNITGESFMTIITANVSKTNISAFAAINRTWSGAMLLASQQKSSN